MKTTGEVGVRGASRLLLERTFAAPRPKASTLSKTSSLPLPSAEASAEGATASVFSSAMRQSVFRVVAARGLSVKASDVTTNAAHKSKGEAVFMVQ
jgi:hypothetical protein